MKKWITFDLDGTLMQNPFGSHVFPEIEKLILMKDNSLSNIIGDILAEHAFRIGANRWVEAYDWDDIVKDFMRKNKISQVIDIEKLVCQFCEVPAIYLLEEKVIEVLQSLKMMDYSIAAVTNGYLKYQKPVLEGLGLMPIFDLIITPSDVGYAKPDHRIFNVLQGEVVFHVGDRVEHDVRSANESGIPSVLISRSLPEEVRCLTIEDRIGCSKTEPYLLAKVSREMKIELNELPAWAKPHHIITSLTELFTLLPDDKD